jgi:ribosome assembly protein YihI (activator of Der GTPase)
MPVSDFIRYKLFEEEKDSYIKGLKKALENEGKFGEQDYQYMDHLQDQIQELKSCIKQISHKGAKLVNLAEEGLNKNKLMVREFNQKHPC